MCGRYQFTAEDSKEIRRIVQEVQERCGRDQFTPGDVYPSNKAPVLLEAYGAVEPDLLYWGFQTPQALVINARSETANQRSLFRDSLEQRRCVIPSTGFYEWSKDKRKYLFRLPDQPVLYMAGIYQERDGKNCYCIFTTEANDSVRDVHPRMPVVLTPELINSWIMEPAACRDLLKKYRRSCWPRWKIIRRRFGNCASLGRLNPEGAFFVEIGAIMVYPNFGKSSTALRFH